MPASPAEVQTKTTRLLDERAMLKLNVKCRFVIEMVSLKEGHGIHCATGIALIRRARRYMGCSAKRD